MRRREIPNWAWLALLWLEAMAALWAVLSRGYPPAMFAMFGCWVLGITWVVLDTRRADR